MKQAAVFFLFYALKKWLLFHDLNLCCGALAAEPERHRHTRHSRKANVNELLQRERKEEGKKGENRQHSNRTSGNLTI